MKYMINDNGTDREMTADEIKQHKIGIELAEQDLAKHEAINQEIISARASAHKKLTALGLTDEEIAALVK